MYNFWFLFLISNTAMGLYRPTPNQQHANQEYQARFKRKLFDSIDQVIKKQRDINQKIDGAYLPLCLTCESDEHIELTRQLLKYGANPNLEDSSAPPLTIACGNICIETMRLLLSYGANTTLQGGYFKQTPLHALCIRSSQDPDLVAKKVTVAKLLLQAKAPLHLKNIFDKTPFDFVYPDPSNSPCNVALARLLHSEARYRLVVEIISTRKQNLKRVSLQSPLATSPQDVIKIIVFMVYPPLTLRTSQQA